MTKDVPVETYMNFDKAEEVRKAERRRAKARKYAHSRMSESRLAASDFLKTEYRGDNMNEIQRRKERNK